MWDEFTLPVRYGGDYELTRGILNRVANHVLKDYMESARAAWESVTRKYLIEQAQIEPVVTLVVIDNWIAFTVRYIVDYKQRRVTRNELFTGILDEINKTNGKVIIASGTYAVVEMPTLKVSEVRPNGGPAAGVGSERLI